MEPHWFVRYRPDKPLARAVQSDRAEGDFTVPSLRVEVLPKRHLKPRNRMQIWPSNSGQDASHSRFV